MAERRDFPFYNGQPVEISGRGWLIILVAVAIGFAALILLPLNGTPLNFIPPMLFVAIPLGALALVAGRNWTALFARYGLKEFGISLGFGVLTIVVSFVVGALLSLVTNMTANAGIAAVAAMGPVDLVLFLARTFIQLVGEELTTILPLLAVLWLCTQKLGMSRRTAIIIAVVVSTIWFSSLHLSTYGWNFIQCFGTIGTARIMLILPYLITRNVWVSAGAHIINDWTLFFVTFAGAHAPIGT